MCQGQLRKLGTSNLEKAERYHDERNFTQSLRYSDMALIKLKQLKARPLEVIELLSRALTIKCDALKLTDQITEALECAKERYTLWATTNMRNVGMLFAAFTLIELCIHANQYADAELYARTAYEMITNDSDVFILVDQQQECLATSSQLLAQATRWLAHDGGIASEQKQKAGEEAIALARKALEIHTQQHGADDVRVANDAGILADVLKYFNGSGDDEIIRLYQQAITIVTRVEGSSSLNIAVGKNNLGGAYFARADAAQEANDLNRQVTNLELASTHYRESARIFRNNHHTDAGDRATSRAIGVEEILQRIRIFQARASAAKTKK